MLVIRDAQMDALRDEAVEANLRALADELAPEAGDIDRRELLVRVASEAKAASRRGYVLKDDVRRFVRCALRLGWGFVEAQAWARAIDRDAGLAPEAKLELFEARSPG